MIGKWTRLLNSLLLVTAAVGIFGACGSAADSNTQRRNPNEGKKTPYLVETLYETSDSVVAAADVVACGADPTGQNDSTEAFREALRRAESLGGGTVWVPAGDYIISDSLKIPPLVTLRGDWNDPDLPDFNGDYGSVIHVIPARKGTGGIFMMEECSGVCGLTVYYPDQNIEDVQPYSPTFYLTGSTKLRTMRNITLINAYIGAYVEGINESTNFINFKGTCLKRGMEVESSGDVGIFDRVSFSPKYWAGASGRYRSADAEAIEAYCKDKKTAAFLLHDLEQQQFSRITVEGYEYGILFSAEPTRWMASGPMTEVHITDCTYGIYAEEEIYRSTTGYAAHICEELTAIDCRCGYIISNSVIEGERYAIYNGCPTVKAADGSEMQAYIHLAGVTLKGELYGNVSYTSSGESLDLSGCSMEKERSTRVSGSAFEAVTSGCAEGDIQAALDRVGDMGGGVVYLPAGNYEIAEGLRVPAGTALMGAAASPQRIPNVGTILWCRQSGGDAELTEAQAMVTLAGDCSGVSGIYFMYDANIIAADAGEEISYYPFTVRGEGKGVWAVNCCISGATHGIDFNNCDSHLIRGLFSGCFYSHMEVSGDGGLIENCLANGTVLYRTNGVIDTDEAQTMFPGFFEKYAIPSCTYITVGMGEGEQICNSFIYGAKHMLVNKGGRDLVGINICSDNLGSHVIVQYGGSMTVVNAIVTSVHTFDCRSGDFAVYNPLRNNEPNLSDFIYREG